MGDRSLFGAATRAARKYWFNRPADGEQPPDLLNNESLLAINAAGTGTVALIKADGSDVVTLPSGVTIPAGQTLTVAGTLSVTGASTSGNVRSTAQFDAVTGTTGATLTNITGLVLTVVPGIYRFAINLPMVTTANAGVKVGFKLTTTVLTSIEYVARLFTAAAVAVQHGTTATDQALMAALTAAATINTVIEGTMVVGTGGTMQLQAAQNAAHADTLSIYVGASMSFTRIS